MTERHIKQSTIFETLGKPTGYDDLHDWQKHNLRHNARLTYDRRMNERGFHRWAAYIALEQATGSAKFYAAQNREAEINRRCGANAKTTGKPCRMKPLPGRNRCKYHGGMSTGPKSLEGKIKALSSLVQYKRRPDLLSARIEKLNSDWMNDPDYAPQGYDAGESLPPDF